MFSADQFRRWLAGIIVPKETWKESVGPTLTPDTTATESVALKAVFTPVAPKVKVVRVKKPKKQLGKQPNTQRNRTSRYKRDEDPRDG